MWQQVWDYCTQPLVLTTLTGISVGIFVIGFMLVPRLAVRLPADHFVRPEDIHGLRTLGGWAWHLCRNLLAIVLLIAGVAMIILPGPGIISIIVAIALADFPGKRRVERAFIRAWIVRTPLNAMRIKYGALPIIIPEADGSCPQSKPGTVKETNPYESPQSEL